jgi:hypothetical protein
MLCIHHALLERKKGNVSCSAQDPIQLPINQIALCSHGSGQQQEQALDYATELVSN